MGILYSRKMVFILRQGPGGDWLTIKHNIIPNPKDWWPSTWYQTKAFNLIKLQNVTIILLQANIVYGVWFFGLHRTLHDWSYTPIPGYQTRKKDKQLYPDSKVHGANIGPTWVLSAPDGPHVGPVNLAIRVYMLQQHSCWIFITFLQWSLSWNLDEHEMVLPWSLNYNGKIINEMAP